MQVGIDRLIADLAAAGCSVDGPKESDGKHWALVCGFSIPSGRFAGQRITIAIPAAPDYPSTPPPGLYVSPRVAPMDVQSVHNRDGECSGLGGGEWQYWSRPVPQGTWEPARGGKRLIAHWNAVFERYGA